MDYDAIDREASRCVVRCRKLTTTFYLTPEGTATDYPERAARFRDSVAAERAAKKAREEQAWAGFAWESFPAIGLPTPAEARRVAREQALRDRDDMDDRRRLVRGEED